MGKVVILIVLILGFMSSVYAISTDLKSEYGRGETIIIEISGNIQRGIAKGDIELRRKNAIVPFEYDIGRLGDKYLLWGIAPSLINNYALWINDISTIVNGNAEEIDFHQNFSVMGNLTDYSIKPGFILTDKDFVVNIQLNEDKEKSIKIDYPSERNAVLKPGKNTLDFSVESAQEGLKKINIGKYVFYMYFFGRGEILEKPEIRLEPNAIVSTIFMGNKTIYPFRIINFGEKEIDGMKLVYNKEIFYINSSETINLDRKSVIELSLSFVGNVDDEIKKKGIDEKIKLEIGKNLLEMPVIIRFTENKSEVKTSYLEENLTYYCSELKGVICSANETCGGKNETSIDGLCCIGKCVTADKEKGVAWIGYVIVVLALVLLIYIFRRYRKSKVTGDVLSERISDIKGKRP